MQSKSGPNEQKSGKTEAEKAKMLKKKTPEELAALANKKTFSTESIDEPAPLERRPSELSMDPLKNQLKAVPMVMAFNSAENHFIGNKSKEEEKKNQDPTSPIIDFDRLECQKMFEGDPTSLARGSLFKIDDSKILDQIQNTNQKCREFQRIFEFFKKAKSQEEKHFPIAYGMLVHDNFVQLSLLLSAIYQPQNQFCLAIDGNSTQEFVDLVHMLSGCYTNIHYFVTDEIRWCGYEILTSVFKCVEYLSILKSDWKYFQYLSGVDAPLKSNLEMVRIFKALNGSFNAEISPFEYYRLNRKLPWNSPLPLYKTSLSATFSRESANFMVTNEKVRKQIEFLRGTTCADESLWATVAGNPKLLNMPGGFDAGKWLMKHRRMQNPRGNYSYNHQYYVSRYQQYVNRPPAKCQGEVDR